MESCYLGAGEILRLLFSLNTVDKQMYMYDNRICLYHGILSYGYIVTTLVGHNYNSNEFIIGASNLGVVH